MHIIGATLVVFVCLIALVLTGKIRFGEPPAKVVDDPRGAYIRVDSASWGLNCPKTAPTINTDTTAPASAPSPTDDPSLPPVRLNNILRPVSSQCNTQLICTVSAAPESLGNDPSPDCSKEIIAEYHCVDFGPIKQTSGTGDVKLSCEDEAKEEGSLPPDASSP